MIKYKKKYYRLININYKNIARLLNQELTHKKN